MIRSDVDLMASSRMDTPGGTKMGKLTGTHVRPAWQTLPCSWPAIPPRSENGLSVSTVAGLGNAGTGETVAAPAVGPATSDSKAATPTSPLAARCRTRYQPRAGVSDLFGYFGTLLTGGPPKEAKISFLDGSRSALRRSVSNHYEPHLTRKSLFVEMPRHMSRPATGRAAYAMPTVYGPHPEPLHDTRRVGDSTSEPFRV